MPAPAPDTVLASWESGLDEGPPGRGLALLALACPDIDENARAALSVGERDRRLLGLRQALFGPRMTGLANCAACGECLEFDLVAAELVAPPPQRTAQSLMVRRDEWELALRLPDSRDLIAAAADPAQAAELLFERSICSAVRAGAPVAARNVPAELRAEASRCLAAADPQTDTQLALTCAACGASWRSPFDILSFLWSEIDAWAARLLGEVHAIAAAYGWAERDILALSPVRRRRYLRMLDA